MKVQEVVIKEKWYLFNEQEAQIVRAILGACNSGCSEFGRDLYKLFVELDEAGLHGHITGNNGLNLDRARLVV